MSLKRPSVKKPAAPVLTKPKVTKPKVAEPDLVEQIDDDGFLVEKSVAIPAPAAKPGPKPKKPKPAEPAAAPVAETPVPVPDVQGQMKLGPQDGWNEAGSDNTEEGDGDHGVKYVRMLNLVGLVRPVDVDHVADRLCDGYFFITDEPAVPRVTGDPQRCDGESQPGFTIRPFMDGGRPTSIEQAMKMWLHRMTQDRYRFEGRKDLLWRFADQLREKMYRRKANDNMEEI